MNRLALSTSAYLRQHADNPVDWWPWGEDALERARELDRPIFLSIGYAACHWCHVMAHESFEDLAIAEFLNKHFIAIKVDREERPDLDTIYMTATQLVKGQGGWPMSVFLTPDGRPFLAGTYYPPSDRAGTVGFPRLLRAVRDAWTNARTLVTDQADQLDAALRREVSFIDHLTEPSERLDLASIRRRLREELTSRLDEHGGFGRAPKFPRPSYVDALMDGDDETSRQAATLTLHAMSHGGLYDHFGGGFARYSVDDRWRVPHFEKMLSDQALLALCYLRAHRRTENDEWHDVALQTLHFVRRELATPDGYASSLDADAAGIEGSHITWTPDEVTAVLEEAGLAHLSDAVMRRWQITPSGDLDGRSVPNLAPGEPFVTPMHLDLAHRALQVARQRRPQPSRDDKVVLEWNAMVARAFFATGDTDLIADGRALLDSLRATHLIDGTWFRVGQRAAHATASDLAWLIDAELDAFEVNGDDSWLQWARDDAAYLLAHYWDGPLPTRDESVTGTGLYESSDLVTDVLVRTKGLFDGATPSGHAVATRALARLGLIDERADLLGAAQRLVEVAGNLLTNHPTSVPDLVDAAGFALDGVEVVIPGPVSPLSGHLRLMSMPHAVLVTGSGSSPLLAGRKPGWAYVCRRGVCLAPVRTVDQLDDQLRSIR